LLRKTIHLTFDCRKDIYELIDVLTILKVVDDDDAGVARRRTFPVSISESKVDNNSLVFIVPYSVLYVVLPS
jgi:hypothetical protein